MRFSPFRMVLIPRAFCLAVAVLAVADDASAPFECGSHAEATVTLRLLPDMSDRATWFKDVIVPLALDSAEVSLATINTQLLPQFLELCEGEQAKAATEQDREVNSLSASRNFVWSQECATNLLLQAHEVIRRRCSLKEANHVSNDASNNDDDDDDDIQAMTRSERIGLRTGSDTTRVRYREVYCNRFAKPCCQQQQRRRPAALPAQVLSGGFCNDGPSNVVVRHCANSRTFSWTKSPGSARSVLSSSSSLLLFLPHPHRWRTSTLSRRLELHFQTFFQCRRKREIERK